MLIRKQHFQVIAQHNGRNNLVNHIHRPQSQMNLLPRSDNKGILTQQSIDVHLLLCMGDTMVLTLQHLV